MAAASLIVLEETLHLLCTWVRCCGRAQLLARSGINLTPADGDAVLSRKPLKTALAERHAHANVAGYARTRGALNGSLLTRCAHVAAVPLLSVVGLFQVRSR